MGAGLRPIRKGVETPPDPGEGAESACASNCVRERTEVKSHSSRDSAEPRKAEGLHRDEQGGAVSDSQSMMNPSGGIDGRRCATQPTLHVALMEEVLAAENLRRAWKRVKANRGAPGIDGMHIEDFPEFAREQWPTIRERLSDGSYRPQPVRRVMIPKPGGGERALGIPTVTDRLIQQAIAQVLTPIFDPGFSESSFGFRPNRSRSRSAQTGTSSYPGGLSRRRRSGPGEVLRQRPARHPDGPRGQTGGRQEVARADRPLPAGGRDGR